MIEKYKEGKDLSYPFRGTGGLLICSCWILAVGLFYYPKWNYPQTESTISWDVSGYYFYLPAIFIYKDLKQQKFKENITQKYEPTPDPYQSYKYRNGNYVMKYSAGMAILYSPFFFIAHMLARPLGYAADGFSYPYQVAIGIEGLLISILGLVLLRKILIRYFSSITTAIVLFLYVFGTNYLEYAAITNAMTHNYLFTLYCLLILTSISYYTSPTTIKALYIGLLVGLATLIRPTEIISCLIPLCLGIGSNKELTERLRFFRTHISHGLIAVTASFLVISIQLIYWKYVSGVWIVYSYQNEGFNFLHPHIAQCLWQFRKGWLVYTPMMIFVVPGFYFLYQKKRSLFYSCLIFFLIFTYICFSWSIWWYGGSIGQRAMVQSYPILAIPFAAFIEWAKQKRIRVFILSPFLLLFIYYNLWLHQQAHKGGLLDPENMTRAYWKKILFRYYVPEDAKKLLDTDEEFNGTRKDIILRSYSHDSIELDSAHQFSSAIHLLPTHQHKWLRVSGTFYIPVKEWDVWKMTQLVVQYKVKGKVLKNRFIRLQRMMNDGDTKTINLDSKIPVDAEDIIIFLWNSEGKEAIVARNIKVEEYD
jgi:hypothetical protein